MTTIPPETPPESNPHTEQVRALMVAVREVLQRIPDFTYPAKGERVRLNYAMAAKDDFLEALAVAIEASEAFAVVSPITPRELREEIALNRAHSALAADFAIQRAAVLYTMQLRRAGVVDRALHAYSMAKGLNRSGESALVPHLEMIKKALGLGRPSSRPVSEEPPDPQAVRGAA